MYTNYISSSTSRTALDKYLENVKSKLDKYLNEKYAKASNVIIGNLPSINGLPLSAFLSRISGITPLIQPGNKSLGNMLDELCKKLSSADSETNESTKKITYEEKISVLRTFCQISANCDNREAFGQWLITHASIINECIANCLSTEHRDLIQEACYTIAYLARVYRFQIYDKIEGVIASMVRTMALLLSPWENYVEQYRDAKDRHNDMELTRGRSFMFHYPPVEYTFLEANHRALGCIYYTLGDLVFSLPSPRLICFFVCRIFHRKEMTRGLLFTILHVIVLNLVELRSEAERLSTEGPKTSTVDASSGPLTSRKGQIYDETKWNELPANLYSDIIRVYNDRNRANKIMITEIMAILRAQAPENHPLFEEATLKALELYTSGTVGRVGEIYQIGRTTVRESDGSGVADGSHRKSFAPKDTGGPTIRSIGGLLSVSDKARSSRHGSADLSIGEAAKGLDDMSNQSSESTSSINTYSTMFTRDDDQLNRKSLVPPKLPNLIQRKSVHRQE